MEFIVCSDNHGRREPLLRLLEHYPHAEGFIHCGDSELTQEETKAFHIVSGNTDLYNSYPEFLIVTLAGIRIYVTHSHTLPYGQRLKALAQKAKDHDCRMACYGHTHIYDEQEVDGVICLNPGSLFYNRDGSKPCYARVCVQDGVLKIQRKLLEELF